MWKPFAVIVSALTWVGKEVDLVPKEIEKVVTVTKDVEADAATLCPQVVTLIDDVGNLVTSAVKDAGSAITVVDNLIGAIIAAAKADAINIADDEAVVAAFEAVVTEVTTKTNYVDVFDAIHKLTADYDVFAPAVRAAVAKLEADVTA